MERESFAHRHSHIIIILLAAVLGALVTLLVLYGIRGQPVATPPVQAQSRAAASAVEESFIRVAERTLPAVVNISAERVSKERLDLPDIEEFFREFKFPFPFEFRFGPEEEIPRKKREFQRRAQSLGSGWIYSADGYIVTNAHVVRGAREIKVRLHDEDTDDRQYDAKLVGVDPKTELAVLKVDAGRRLPTLKLGDSDAVKVGQWAMAVGAPFGLQQTVTVGVISAKGRFLPGQSQYIRIGDVIQTDAAINPGNSGGPLVNLRGEVIGINVAIVSPGFVPGNVGIGFAIPANRAKKVVPALIKEGKVARGWLGIGIQDLTANLREFYGCPNGGAIVTQIHEGSPASKSGLKEEDVIVAVDGQPVKDTWELQKAIADRKPGTVVTLRVIRGKKPVNVKVRLGEMPAKYAGLEPKEKKAEAKEKAVLGLTVRDITPELRQAEDLPDVEGVVVVRVSPDSPAADRLEPGDIITKINDTPIKSVDDYDAALRQARREKAKFLVVKFVRKGEEGDVVSLLADIPTKW